MKIGERIAQLRKSAGYTRIGFAEKIGLPHTTLRNYETGTREPGHSFLIQMANEFEVSTDFLLGLTEDPTVERSAPDYFAYDNILPFETKKIPLLGSIAAGKPIFAEQDCESYVDCGNGIQADFSLRVKGDSMVNARILDGDVVFIRKQPLVENGEIAAVIIDNEATLKRVFYYPESQKLMLISENPQYVPFMFVGNELENVRILGKAIAFQSDVR